MEWKKIASMEYGKIVFHSIPFHTMPCFLEHWAQLQIVSRKLGHSPMTDEPKSWKEHWIMPHYDIPVSIQLACEAVINVRILY